MTRKIEAPKVGVLRVTETDGVGQNISNPYWSNLFGKDASDAEVWTLLDNQGEEDNTILITVAFFLSILEEDYPNGVLQSFVHPATVNDWGDFQMAREFVRSFSEMGLSTKVRFNDRHDIAYVYLLENVTDSILIQEHQIVQGITVVNLVKEKSSQRWLVYSIGDKMDDYLIKIEPIKAIKKGLVKLTEKMSEADLFK